MIRRELRGATDYVAIARPLQYTALLKGADVGKVQKGDELIQLDGGRLGVLSFEWQDDRYRHFWTFSDSDAEIQSIESGSNEPWPLSPPLQQIHSQSFGDGREVIFGVGMAGRGHWSASFTLVPELKCWIVELACRSGSTADRLRNSYEISRSAEASPLAPSEDRSIVIYMKDLLPVRV